MARRANTRRRNRVRSTGTLIINPRRRNARKKKRKTTAKRRRNVLAVRRSNTRRRNTARRSNTRRRNTARRANTRRRNTRRRNTRRRNSKLLVRRSNRRRNTRRTNRRRNYARRTNRRRNTRRRNTRRRNPGMMKGLEKQLKKVPVVGKLLASAAGFLTPTALGALAVEPTLMVAKFGGRYLPTMPSSWFYVGTGLVLAAAVANTKFFGAAFHKKLALAIASATGGVAYYKWRTGSDVEMATEAGALELHGIGSWADGLAYSVLPMSGAANYGATIYGR